MVKYSKATKENELKEIQAEIDRLNRFFEPGTKEYLSLKNKNHKEAIPKELADSLVNICYRNSICRLEIAVAELQEKIK